MKVAIISFDVKYIEDLRKNLENIEVIQYGDTVSFLKDIENTKPELIIYDTTSGIFAEDDLKYLLTKSAIEDGKIFGLISPENPIDINQFSEKVKFFHKFNQLQDLISELNNMKPTEIKEPNQLKFEEKVEENSPSESLSDFEFLTKNPGIQEELIEYNDIATQDITISKTPFEIEFNEIPQQETTIDIPSTLELEFNDLSLQSEDLDLKIEEEKTRPTEIIEFEHIPEMENLPQIESINEFSTVNNLEESKLPQELHTLENLVTPAIKPVEEKVIEEIIETPSNKEKGTTLQELISSKKEESPIEKLTGGEKMIANFNIQISDEEIKKLALQVTRDFLEKDPAMEKIIDHLQIDFQEETRKELENLKLELREKLRQEAEKLISEEIRKLLKEELKDYVTEITTKIIKEKIEQIFKVS
ncbi:MAG: hypothetical protein ABWJ98_06805 [Hydrogenothermaceae bacterium]